MILITAGLGGLGSELAKNFTDKILTTSRQDQTGHNVFYWNMKEKGSSKELLKKLPEIDTFIHCAHIFSDPKLTPQLKQEDFIESLSSNLGELFELTKGLARKMNRKKKGNIIYIGSALAKDPAPGKFSYVTEKLAMEGMIGAFRSEFPQLNWNIFHPGLIDTPQVREKTPPNIMSAAGKLLETKEVTSKIMELINHPTPKFVHVYKGDQNWNS